MAAPALERIEPPGGKQGAEVEIRITGTELDEPQELFFEAGRISVAALTGENNVGTATLRIPADCPPGPQRLRLRTAEGLSDLRMFHVHLSDQLEEQEPNDAPESAQPIAVGQAVWGTLRNEDVDTFQIHLPAGGRISAVVEAVRATAGVDANLKWPNDVLVGEGKLGGILAEVAAPDPVIVVGLGLNVTLTADEAPDARATSLLMLGSTMLDRSALLGAVLAELAIRIDRWRCAGGPDATLLADYRRRSLTLGTRVRALLPGDREIIGMATDLDESGQLSIDTGAQTVTVSAGDITHLRPAGD